jgi:tetratricopeptide (TPR) repeat protein
MKKILFSLLIASAAALNAHSQIQRPMASPQGKVEQKVGLTDIKIEYYRPSKNGRVVFGDVVPFDELWRTGANENTKFTCSDPVVFGKDTLKAGTYAIFTKPAKEAWEVIFYTDITNWGTPDEFDEKKVALRSKAKVAAMNDVTETFTISIDNLTIKTADLNFTWDKTRVTLNFSVPTAKKMNASIDKVMAGPSGGDYYAAAEFYFKEKQDMKKALEWVNKAVEARPEAYWILRLKSQIQAELGDYKGAIETAKLSMASAEKDGNKAYIDMNKASIEEWQKKK